MNTDKDKNHPQISQITQIENALVKSA